MTTDWPEVRLGDVAADITVGYVSSMTHEYRDAGVPFLRSQDIKPHRIDPVDLKFISPEFHERISKSALHPGDVVVVRTGAPGTAAVIPTSLPEANCADLVVIRPGPRIAPRYLAYFFNSTTGKRHVHAHTVGAVQQHFNVGAAREARIRLPTLDEQRAIAHVLGAFDDKIELNRRTNETLEAMARALFKSWFVDFDPVRAKAKKQAPVAMDAATAALFPDRFEESELGAIPRGWRVGSLGEVLDLDKGVSYKGEFLRDDGVPMVNLGCFKGDGVFDESRVKGYAGEIKDRHWVSVGDLVIANTDMTQNRVVLGSPGLVPRLGSTGRVVFSHHVFAARFRSDPTGATKLYCYFALLQPEFRARAAGFASGTTVLALPRDAVLNLAVVVPPSDVSERFAGVCDPWLKLTQANADQSKSLAALRDLLLPRLLAGELCVRDAEKAVEQIA